MKSHNKSKDSTCFARAIRKYGKDAFTWEIIASATTIEELNLLEERLIAEHCTLVPSGYNIHTGGRAHKATAEEKARLSALHKGHHRSPSTEIKPGQHLSRSTELKKGCEPRLALIVINIMNGVVYDSVKEAALAHNIKPVTLHWRLRYSKYDCGFEVIGEKKAA